MIILTVKLVGRKGNVSREALIDTGFTSGLLLPKTVARQVGAVLVEPRRLPRLLSGKILHGKSTIIRVDVPEAGVSTETIVFCPDQTPEETLIGAFFLAQVQASMTIGRKKYKFLMPNPAYLDPYDLGDVIVPLDRPRGPWL